MRNKPVKAASKHFTAGFHSKRAKLDYKRGGACYVLKSVPKKQTRATKETPNLRQIELSIYDALWCNCGIRIRLQKKAPGLH